MYDKYGQFIDGKWQKSASGETYDVINPATEEIIGKASKANSADVQKALKSAEKGLASLEKYFSLGKIKNYQKDIRFNKKKS